LRYDTTTTSPILSKTLLQPEISVNSGITEIDTLLAGFRAGTVTYVDGDSKLIADLPNRLCVNTYQQFHAHTLYLDGGLCADPYEIARYARALELDQYEVLHHVYVSRAFTVYQLSTLIEQHLEPMLQQYHPQTLIIGRFPLLHLDPDVPSNEAHRLLQNNLQTLQRLTKKHMLITILTNKETYRFPGQQHIRKLIYRNTSEVLRLRYIEPCTYVDLVHQRQGTMIRDHEEGQLQLDQFGMVS